MEFGEDLSEGQSHFDTHADTCAGGSNFALLDQPEKIQQHVDASPFSEEYEPIKGIPVASCATSSTDLEKEETYILVFHHMLYFGKKLSHSLLCPNQIRDQGNVVEDCPRQYSAKSNHGMTLHSKDEDDTLFIPMDMEGIISFIDTRLPTNEELRTCKCYFATSLTKYWDPHNKGLISPFRNVQGNQGF